MNMRTLLGPLLILLGAYLLFNASSSVEFGPGMIFGYFWPTLFVIPLGIFFHWLYFFMIGRKGVGLLIPGGVLFTVGIVCQISMLFDLWAYSWPGFILAPAVGLFEFYWFGNRNKWLLIPINILVVISLLFFAVFTIGNFLNQLTLGSPLLAGGIILIGVLMLFMRRKEL